ncbi:MAG: M1 family metallopeptidase [Chitinophagaceae bacterium]
MNILSSTSFHPAESQNPIPYKMAKAGLIAILACCQLSSSAQLLSPKTEPFTHADTLRGTLNESRTWWDVKRYDINVTPDYETKTIKGKTTIWFTTTGNTTSSKMQIDLQEPLIIDSVISGGKALAFEKDDKNDWLVSYTSFSPKKPRVAQQTEAGPPNKSITIYYHGKAREAIRPPWDGGWIWKKDSLNRPWMSVACQGLGASVWYPCKDHQSDEPDNGASLTINVPDTLVAVANGRLISTSKANGIATYTWQVKNPINNYNIIPYIGKYVHFGEIYKGEKGNLDCNYWVLDYNLVKAKEQFKQVPKMLEAFEHWFGPYPFYEDGYKLVEAPHLGMEHQSAVAYGNYFLNGRQGRGSSLAMKFDYIIVHESGHEWFANNITTKDIADMWVHESFTCYGETLYLEYWFGKDSANKYLLSQRRGIGNKSTMVGPYGVNKEGADIYNKGANMIHTIRQVINDDEKFRAILRGLNKTFYHQTITTKQLEDFISKESGFDFSKFFDQYLRTTKIPVLQWKYEDGELKAKWTNCVDGFDIPIRFFDTAGKMETIRPNAASWTSVKTSIDASSPDLWEKNFYVNYEKN